MSHPGEHRLGMAPTPRQLAWLRSYAEHGDLRRTAHALEIAYSTLKNELSGLYARLGVSGAMEAAVHLGWFGPPCGWVGVCNLPAHHKGSHHPVPAPTGAAQDRFLAADPRDLGNPAAPPPPRQDQQEVS